MKNSCQREDRAAGHEQSLASQLEQAVTARSSPLLWHLNSPTLKHQGGTKDQSFSRGSYGRLCCDVCAAHDLGPSQRLLSLSSLPQSHQRRHF